MKNKNQISEKDFLKNYDASLFERPNVSVDTVILTIIDHHLHVLTMQRAEHPFKEQWSLVGGFIDIDKDLDLEETAKRKLAEKTGIHTPYLEQFNTVGNKNRDPRGWSVTTIYFALIACEDVQLSAGTGALDIKWSKIKNGKIADKLAFDHTDILSSCIERLRSKVLYTTLPAHFLQKEFTLSELQKVYEIIMDHKIDHKSFRRRMLSGDILVETNHVRNAGTRPAQLFKLKKKNQTHFFVRNIEGKK